MRSIPSEMSAVLLVGHGGLDQLKFRTDVPVPSLAPGEVLVAVGAAGVNNTDVNTRVGWYSKAITSGTGAIGSSGTADVDQSDAAWSGKPLEFPRIQGADCCGEIVAVAGDVSADRIGERVLVRNMLRSYVGYRPYECWTFGSECDGAFAQFAKAPSREVYKVDCGWSDAELASVPCAYSTAELLLHRARVTAGDTVLVSGASGGVGSAAVQLAKRRGATVIAIASPSKAPAVAHLGADRVIDRDSDPKRAVGNAVVDVVIDVVGGAGFGPRLEVLKAGGRCAVAGAISGPIVEVDLRTVYLRDISVLGCTFQEDIIFENLIKYIEANEIRPVVAKEYPLDQIRQAQSDFLSKGHVGKLVLIPPPP
jgi:NADPH:quinone reductase-like Zn-dependent oxidoreductase